MGQTMKKRILIASELISAPAGLFFQNSGYELLSEYNQKIDVEFIVDDFLPEIKHLPRIQIKKSIAAECVPQVRAYIDEKFISSVESSKLLTHYYADFNDFNVVDYYSGQYKNIYTLKIQDYLNIGYFIDTIVVEAYKNKFDHEKIRLYLNEAIPQALKIVERKEHPVHLDVSFSHAEDAFAVQVSFEASASDFKKDFESIRRSSETTNFYDLVYFKKRERASFSAAWFKKSELNQVRAYFFTEVSGKTASDVSLSSLEPVEGPDQGVVYEPKNSSSDQSKKLQLARKFSLFIKNYRDKEEAPKEAALLDISDVDSYLAKYPRQEALKELDDEIKNFILKMIRDDSLYQGVTDFVQKIAGSNLDNHVEEIQRVLGDKSLADIDEILRIKGAGNEQDTESTTVSGWKENLDEEEWKVKRSEIVEQIKEEVTVIKSQGRNVVEDDILRVMSDQLQANPEEMKTVVKGIVEEAVTMEMIQKEKLEEAFARNFTTVKSIPTHDAAKEKLEQQIVRMKKLMEQMKNEMIRLKNENSTQVKTNSVEVVATDNGEVIELKRVLDKTLDQLRNKEKMADKLKSDLESIVQAKNDKIASLEMRIETIKQEFAQSAEFANEEKLEKLQVENKSLLARLELANRKINIISENMEKQDNDSALKKEKEIISLKTNMQSAQGLIEKMKAEKTDLEKQLRDEREKVAKFRDEKSSDHKDKAIEQEILISSLTSDKRSLEEKLKIQNIELKKIEQKMKYTTAQLEEAQKKKGTAGGGQKSNETYIKQLELANGRLAEASSDLTERKKEIHKLKQENALSNAKIAELEKKLANAEKKAA